MSSYPIEPGKLLDVARRLVPDSTGPGRPPYTVHRRAVSTAYYAVFHAVNERVATQVFGAADDNFVEAVRRWIKHGDIKVVSKWVAIASNGTRGLEGHVRPLLCPDGASVFDADTLELAEAFLQLHERREQADYDHTVVLTRADTLFLIQRAYRAVSLAETLNTSSSRMYFGLIAMQARIQSR